MKVLWIAAVILFSTNSYACKLKPVGYTQIATRAALEALGSLNANVSVTSISLDQGLVDIRSVYNEVEQKNVFSILINSDCSVVVNEVQPAN